MILSRCIDVKYLKQIKNRNVWVDKMRKVVKTIDKMEIDEMGINHEKMVPSNLCPKWRLRLSCASAQSDQSLCYPQKETCILSYPKCTQWRFGLNWANAQAALNLLWEHVWRYIFWCYSPYSWEWSWSGCMAVCTPLRSRDPQKGNW